MFAANRGEPARSFYTMLLKATRAIVSTASTRLIDATSADARGMTVQGWGAGTRPRLRWARREGARVAVEGTGAAVEGARAAGEGTGGRSRWVGGMGWADRLGWVGRLLLAVGVRPTWFNLGAGARGSGLFSWGRLGVAMAALAGVGTLPTTTWAAATVPAPTREQVDFFESKIRPILSEHCYQCHSVESGKSKGSLLLDSRAALRKGGGTGPTLVEGEVEKSLLIQAVRYADEDLQMPPADAGGKLAPEKIAALEQWVRMGAPDPRVTDVTSSALNMVKARGHWAFQPLSKAAPPPVPKKAAVATPVDAFILAQLQAKQLAPAAPADPRTLLRRITYDLTGLPPTPDEMAAFLRDSSADAYAKTVERLLASPRYGERWGRFWLDVARYADTKGYLAGNVERRYPFSHTYRDYVIRAFNEDKPFDRFVVEQLAADLLPQGKDRSALAAMGFLTLGRRFLNNQNDIIDDRIDVVSRGFMGLTVTCARCHDHKFDPIPTADYYSLHGVFASSEEPVEKPLLGALVDSPAYQQFLARQLVVNGKIKDQEQAEVKKFLAGVREKTGDYLLGAHAAATLAATEKLDLFAGTRKLNVEVLKRWQPFLLAQAAQPDPVLAPWFAFRALPEATFADSAAALLGQWRTDAAGLNSVVAAAFTTSEKSLASLADVAAIYNRIFAASGQAWQRVLDAAEKTPAAPPTALADPAQEAVRQISFAAGAPANLGFEETARMLKRQIDTKTAPLKRELEALNWTEPGAPLRAMTLTDKTNPRNSKIFIRGNSGNLGEEVPRQFVEVLSGEKRDPFTVGSGRLALAELIASPTNPLTARVLVNRVWGWHFGQPLVGTPSDFGVRTAEPVQRALLDWLARSFIDQGWSLKQLHRVIVRSNTYQQANTARENAERIDPENRLVHHFDRHRLELEALRDTLLADAGSLDLTAGGLPDDLTKEPFTTRRTVYGYIDRQELPGMFRTFDYPNPDVSSAQRFATTVPQQALFLMNSSFAQAQARQLLARSEIKAAGSDEARLAALYRVVYQRNPEPAETQLAQNFLTRPRAVVVPARPVRAAWEYGYGRYDTATQRVVDFQVMAFRREGRVTPAGKYPEALFGYLSLTASGGHPGPADAFASVRRWIAPGKGTIKIVGSLGHAEEAGDGVHGMVVTSAGGRRGQWNSYNKKTATNLDFSVEESETVDFVVDRVGGDESDSYTWSPTITFTPDPAGGDLAVRVWIGKKDFDNLPKPSVPLTRWEELAQVLLLSNELAFVD